MNYDVEPLIKFHNNIYKKESSWKFTIYREGKIPAEYYKSWLPAENKYLCPMCERLGHIGNNTGYYYNIGCIHCRTLLTFNKAALLEEHFKCMWAGKCFLFYGHHGIINVISAADLEASIYERICK